MSVRALFMSIATITVATAFPVQAEKWDMLTAYPSENFHTVNAVKFARCVANETAGALEIAIHPNGSLVGGSDIKRAVETGRAPLGERIISAHADEHALFGIDSIPFIATSFEASQQLWDAAREKLEQLLDSQNLVYLYSVPWPPQGLYTPHEINRLADLKVSRFRAYNAATLRLAELAGMQAVDIEAAELGDALKDGSVESLVSSSSTGIDAKLWEHMTHFYNLQAWLPRNIVFANKDLWMGLDEQKRQKILECSDRAAIDGAKMARKLASDHLEILSGHGVKIMEPDEELQGELNAIGERMMEEWISNAGEDGAAIFRAYRVD